MVLTRHLLPCGSSLQGCLTILRRPQVAKARECEANTGPAGAPQAAGGGAAAQEVSTSPRTGCMCTCWGLAMLAQHE